MGTQPYLIFSLHHQRYAILATEAIEIFLLPELVPVAEAPPDVIGLLNLHNSYIPVMHLDLRFGRKFDRCRMTDSVIVVECDRLQVGAIVHQVETVVDIDDRYIQDNFDYGRERNIDRAFIKGAIDLDDEMIILLDVTNLVRHPHALEALTDADILDSELDLSHVPSGTDFYDLYFPAASNSVRETLAQRAANLKQATDDSEAVELLSIAVVSINDSYFGLDLGIVREFAKIGRITTIPCCPPHIIGNMNLRGEILTLIDIRQPLNLATGDRDSGKAVVIEIEDITAGIVVQEVYDVVDFRPEEVKPVPVATDSQTTAYLKGMVDYLQQPLKVIDLAKLITQGSMKVELTV